MVDKIVNGAADRILRTRCAEKPHHYSRFTTPAPACYKRERLFAQAPVRGHEERCIDPGTTSDAYGSSSAASSSSGRCSPPTAHKDSHSRPKAITTNSRAITDRTTPFAPNGGTTPET